MKVLILGAGGLLGRELRASAPADHEVLALTRKDLDIRDGDRLRRVLRDTQPDWVINASGITDVDRAEREPDLAFAVNASAVTALAALCREDQRGLVHFSTDYVFDGATADCYAEEDALAPLNAYGASKLAGEDGVRQNTDQHLIIRTQWLFGVGGTGFLSALWQRARDRVATRVVADQFGCCTYSVDLARVTWMALGRLKGTYHVANRGRISRFDFARWIFSAVGVEELLAPCSFRDVLTNAARPMNSALCVEKMERAVGYAMPHWTDAVERYVFTRLPSASQSNASMNQT